MTSPALRRPPRRVCLGSIDDFPPGQVHQVGAQGTMLIVAQVADGEFCGVRDECPHLLLPLAGGALDGTQITCPHHASVFDMCTGDNRDWVRVRSGLPLPRWTRRLLDRGKSPPGLTVVPVIVEDGKLYAEL
ncbi:MAG: Rieske 2Fe-2S domain-containing protein [Chloroflexi bacterium]|nr:Rieske 2Fe-2S domain-containing protein [Chloroflexota bacterium]